MNSSVSKLEHLKKCSGKASTGREPLFKQALIMERMLLLYITWLTLFSKANYSLLDSAGDNPPGRAQQLCGSYCSHTRHQAIDLVGPSHVP